MTGRQIPNTVWTQTPALSAFMEEAGLNLEPEPTHQLTLCATCVAEGVEEAPTSVVFVKGTSLCIKHSKMC